MGVVKDFEECWRLLEDKAQKAGTAYMPAVKNGQVRFFSWGKLGKSGLEHCSGPYRTWGLQIWNGEPYALSVDIECEKNMRKKEFDEIIENLYDKHIVKESNTKLLISNVIFYYLLRNDIKIVSYFDIFKKEGIRLSLYHSRSGKKSIVNIIGSERSVKDFKRIHDKSLEFLNYLETNTNYNILEQEPQFML